MIDTIIRALALPKSAMVGRRVPKNLLVEHGAVTVVDRKAVETGIERIDWIASLKPSTIGVAAYSDDEREASEIAVLTMQLRPNAKGARIATLLHRAIPYPLLLVSEMDSAVTISLAPKRHSLAKGSAQVTEAVITSPSVSTTSDDVRSSFLASLSIANLPPASLWSLYCGLIERIEAYAAARYAKQSNSSCNAAGGAGRTCAGCKRIGASAKSCVAGESGGPSCCASDAGGGGQG
jgi:Domain of unknown function (DUF4391)